MTASRWLMPVLVTVTIALVLSVPLAHQRSAPPPPPGPLPAEGAQPGQSDEARQGLRFRLSEGEAAPPRPARSPEVPTTLLPDDRARAILDRLPPLPAEEREQEPFALREGSLPPPLTAGEMLVPFPPAVAVEAQAPEPAGPAEVLRYAPHGDVPLAKNLTVTFSQPMVPVGSDAVVGATQVPVRLWPQPPGQWRWLGTRTLAFEPDGRFPMATEYRVEVPAGFRAASGAVLAKGAEWRFSTPVPVLVSRHPVDEPSKHQPLLFAAFDQRIDPAAVLASVTVRAGAGAAELRLATKEEVEADARVKRLAERAGEGRWLAFVPTQPLPSDADVAVRIGPGTPSAEGPGRTTAAQTWRFKTYGRLQVTGSRCGWNEGCLPGDDWFIELSNAIDAKAFRPEYVRVEPTLPELNVSVNERRVYVRGSSAANTTYTVTLTTALGDAFGQRLERDESMTFRTVDAPPMFTGREPFVVLDPEDKPVYSVFTRNVRAFRVEIRAVTPADWSAFDSREGALPGRLVVARNVDVAPAPNEIVEMPIDLSPALQDGRGHVVLDLVPRGMQRGRRLRAWVQATRIGLAAFADHRDLLAWASDLASGRSLPGVTLSFVRGGATAVTSDDGTARLPLPSEAGLALVARLGEDCAILPERDDVSPGYGWQRRAATKRLRWMAFSDRHLYRPGEQMKVKGLVRLVDQANRGDLLPAPDGLQRVDYAVFDAQGNQVASGSARTNRYGAFDLSFLLPRSNLGPATLRLSASAPGCERDHGELRFHVQEFRRPDFEVTAKVASEGPHVVGTHADLAVHASYYAGGTLGGASTRWDVTSSPASFTPPNRFGFHFGNSSGSWALDRPGRMLSHQGFDAVTDAAGQHRVRIDFDRVWPPRPSSVQVQVSVTDVNRQRWSANTRLLVHPSALYVGLRSPSPFVPRGQPIHFETIVTDLDGRAVAGRQVKVRAERLEWVMEAGEWVERVRTIQMCETTSGEHAAHCRLHPNEGGRYLVTATVRDDQDRPNESEIIVWVAGTQPAPQRTPYGERLVLIPDKPEYRAGEVAEILVMPPFSPAEGLITVSRSGIVHVERFSVDAGSHIARLRLEEDWLPNVRVQVDVVGAREYPGAGSGNTLAPAFASGSVNLSIPPVSRRLFVQVMPQSAALEPGGETLVDLEVRDAAGRPAARTEVTVLAVDEAVLALTGYKLPDPLNAFYPEDFPYIAVRHLRDRVVLGRRARLSPSLLDFRLGGGLAGAPMRAFAPPMPTSATGNPIPRDTQAASIRLRADLTPLALFEPSLVTDSNGRASVRLKLPDNLTRYRIMAVAATDGVSFGSGESAVTARLPLMVRPSPPRFLNFGDEAELPIVVQNQTDRALRVELALRATNARISGAGRALTVRANERVEVKLPIGAAKPGTARFQVAAVSEPWTDANEFTLPVWTPATTEAFTTYGQLDAAAAISQPIVTPPGVIRQFGGLDVTTSSTALQALTDAVLYLVSYPFECSEQLASRVMAISALRDVLTAFEAEGLPKPDELTAAVKRDVEKLARMQNEDGGFAFWRRGDESWPFLGIYTAQALHLATAKGFDVPDQVLERSRQYLRDIERRIPQRYGVAARTTLVAYAVSVRTAIGDPDVARARALVRGGLDHLSLEAVGWLLSALAGQPDAASDLDTLRRHLVNRASETAATASFTASYGDDDYLVLHSNRRADAVVLDALIRDQPRHDLIPKIVEGLLGHRIAGRWSSTQENAFVLLALDRYFAAYEKTTPDFVARAWLGERYAGEQAFRGRSTERRSFQVPMSGLGPAGQESNLVLSKEGTGRLYYRIGLRYAPETLRLQPADRGFIVSRVYEPVDDKQDVMRDADGTWRIRAGARVRVRVSMVAESRRNHVALVDPLPAGLEPLNPELKSTGYLPPDEQDQAGTKREPWWWRRAWYDHENLRDDRVEAFTSLLAAGSHSYSYIALATTPGTFIVPPPKAEEMYHPETFGRGASDRVIVR